MRFDIPVTLRLKDAYHARGEPEAVRILGGFYWSVLILVSALLIAGGIGYGVWEFVQPRMGEVTESSIVIPPKKIFTKSSIQKILQGLDDRARNYDLQKGAPIPVKDPS